MHSVFTHAILSVLLLGNAVSVLAAPQYTGCFLGRRAGTAGIFSGQYTSPEACVDAQGAGYSYVQFRRSSNLCALYTEDGYGNTQTQNAGTPGNCATAGDVDTRIISTTFVFTQCASSFDIVDGRLPVTVATPFQCFDRCRQTLGAVMQPNAAGYTCACATSSAAAETCGASNYLIYTHAPAFTSGAGQARRKRRLAQDAFSLCPAPRTACRIPNTSSYECLDTNEELESCGGCVHGDYLNATASAGIDCSAIEPLGSATCQRGKCISI